MALFRKTRMTCHYFLAPEQSKKVVGLSFGGIDGTHRAYLDTRIYHKYEKVQRLAKNIGVGTNPRLTALNACFLARTREN